MKIRKSAVLSTVLVASPAAGFIIPTTCSPSFLQKLSPPLNSKKSATTLLHAKKSGPAKKKKTPANSSSSGGGGGFGSSTSNDDTSNKVRSVSGYTGSGTKPLRIAANTFDALRKKHGKDCTCDIYVRSPSNDAQICWFVGKVAREVDAEALVGTSVPSEMEAVLSQKRLILEYAKNQLRPQNLGGPYSKHLELWMAPGDSEMDAVQNKVSFIKVDGSTKDLSEGFSVSDVGYNPEIYVGDEIKDGGLRVLRDEEGVPVKAAYDINQ
uniref:Uncharacterized protein n=1 Tax=Ditylum brightwellii TaxID=49249 RepID=A0A7S4T578_9STRA